MNDKERDRTLISLLYDYTHEHLSTVLDIIKFVGEDTPERLTLDQLGPLSRKEIQGLYSGFKETEILRLQPSGRILVVEYFNEYSYSENTTEPASVTYTGYTPRVK